MNVEQIIDALEAQGFTFPEGRPTRAHFRPQGEEPRTFLTFEYVTYDVDQKWEYDEYVTWVDRDGREGCKLVLTVPLGRFKSEVWPYLNDSDELALQPYPDRDTEGNIILPVGPGPRS